MRAETRRLQGLDGGVLVGVDGSANSRCALRAAAEEARLRGCVLHVVRAWGLANAPRPADAEPGYIPSFAEFEAEVERWLRVEVTAELGPEPGVEVALHTPHAAPAGVIIEASRDVDRVVVGARGVGGFLGLLLGSVGEQVVRHAHCPVLVVPLDEHR